MHDSELSSGAAAACGRLDALVRTVGPELGRWMLELAERLAAEGRRCRSIDGDEEGPAGGGGA
jgi:hypothetical protein